MAKSSTRFRNRKINFKTRIPVRTGIHALDAFDEDGLEGGMDIEDEKEGHKDTGVDKEEEGEVHLQAVLASSSASVTRGTSFTLNLGARNSGVSISTTQKPKAFIPTPDSTGTIDQALFDRLYPSDAFVDPISYIKFSDTVEEAQIGAVNYTMDEDDEDWLEAYNLTVVANLDGKTSVHSSPVGASLSADASRGGRARVKGDKGKGSEVAMGPIGEDEFEEIMELFERITEEKAPMAHVNTASLPQYEDFEDAFIGSHVRSSLRAFAKPIYPHWKERRLKRSGKGIIPQLDYDESNEQNPYVCFRRRELKTSRKTRRSDAQNIERLVRLRNDLFAAHALMVKTRDRERLKLETVQLERKIFEGRVQLRDLKRRTGEAEGDEDLLIGRREKKKKRDDGQPGSIRLSIRKPEGGSGFSSSTLASTAEDLRALKERAAIIHQRIERDVAKKREADSAFEDFTDNPYTPRPPSAAARCWRTVESLPVTSPATDGVRESYGFASQYQHPAGSVRTSFRRRVGRGGRVMLDRISSAGAGRRILPRARIAGLSGEESEEEDADVAARRAERFRFDMDTANDFPTADEPTVVDDYAFVHMVRRAALLRPADVESLTIDGSYLEEAYRFASREPERHPPPQVINRLAPPRAALPTQAGGPGGIPVGAQSANAISSIMAAASQAHRVAQQQAQLKRTAAGSPQVQNGSPLSQTLPLSMPIQSGFASHNAGSPQPYGQQQRMPSGTNGATKPPFTVQQQQQILLQQQQMQQLQQQQLGQAPESRPSSATSHHSPSLLAQGLPQSPHSPGGVRPLLPIKRTSPFPPQALLPIAISNSPVGLPPNYNPFPQVS